MEKTFEELIEEKRFEHSYMDGEDMVENHILQLLQQVRESTIAECFNEVIDSEKLSDVKQRFKNLQTDRIKIKMEEKELRKNGNYIVVAKQWSKIDSHTYIVDLCAGIDEAKDVAEKEMQERGGKYGM